MRTRYFIWFFFLFLFASAVQLKAQRFKEINGLVLSESGKDPIPYCNVYIKDTYIGTVSNSGGSFTIRITPDNLDKTLVISSIGFATLEIPLATFDYGEEEQPFYLESVAQILSEVEVPNADLILREAVKRIPQNYPPEYLELTTFYRELIRKNKAFVDISQGVLNVSKTPYTQTEKESRKNHDEIHVYKGHRMTNYSGNDTLAFKVMGGPNTMMQLDVVKNPGRILGATDMENYEYSFDGIQLIDGRRSYVLSFKERPESENFLYEGVIYIDEKSFAVAAVVFSVPKMLLQSAGEDLVHQKPSLAILTPEKLAYEVRYRESGGMWFLDYVRNEIEMKVNWKRKLFNSRFHATTELVVTDKKPLSDNSLTLGKSVRTNQRELFSDKIAGLQDTEYWEDFSIIRPEEELKKAILKIAKE